MCMEIKSTIYWEGATFDVVYRDIDNNDQLEDRKVSGVHAWCFYKDALVIVHAGKKNRWTPPGGGVEKDEDSIDAMIREVKEETNMKVLRWAFIGYQDVFELNKFSTQARFVCLVEPYGDFVEDPDEGDITEIKLIDPKDYIEYFNWGEVGEHIMQRALKLLPKL